MEHNLYLTGHFFFFIEHFLHISQTWGKLCSTQYLGHMTIEHKFLSKICLLLIMLKGRGGSNNASVLATAHLKPNNDGTNKSQCQSEVLMSVVRSLGSLTEEQG